VPQAPTDVPLPLSPQEELPPDGANDLVIASAGTEVNSQVPDHPPADKDTVGASEVQEDAGDIGSEANASNPIDIVASDGHPRMDIEEPPSVSSKCSDVDVEALQERLRLVEQRFSGMS